MISSSWPTASWGLCLFVSCVVALSSGRSLWAPNLGLCANSARNRRAEAYVLLPLCLQSRGPMALHRWLFIFLAFVMQINSARYFFARTFVRWLFYECMREFFSYLERVIWLSFWGTDLNGNFVVSSYLEYNLWWGMQGFCIFYNILLVEYLFLRNHSQTTGKMRCNLSNYSCLTNNFVSIY